MDYKSIFNFTLAILFFPVYAQSQNIYETYPSWEENFNETGFPNKTLWSLENHLSGTKEVFFTGKRKENIYIEDGVLKLTIRKENYKGATRTSSFMKSIPGFIFGKIEIRAKFPVSKGIWPTLWLRPLGNHSNYGEIDIAEYIDCWHGNHYQANLHLVQKIKNKEKTRQQHAKTIPNNMSEYHIYGVEWNQNNICFFLDGTPIHVIKKESVPFWPFGIIDYHLTISLDYGGWAASCGIDDKALPQTLEIDWIKYYKIKE